MEAYFHISQTKKVMIIAIAISAKTIDSIVSSSESLH